MTTQPPLEGRLNGLEHKLSPQGAGDSCWKCGGLPARSARMLIVKNLDEVGKCQQCGLSVGPDGRPWGTRGAGGVVHQKVLVLR